LIRSLYSAIRVKKNELRRNHQLPAACGQPAEFNRWHFLETLFKQGNENRQL
jgi:hypothetical protein